MSTGFDTAKAKYAELGVDVENALDNLKKISLSMHCWQGDDVGGFENPDGELSGGIAVTGNHPGKARNIDELRADLEKAYSLLPGDHRLALHAIYGDFQGRKVERSEIGPEHFKSWSEWGEANKVMFDFNPTLFSHLMADSGYTLSSKDKSIRDFWIEHTKQSRSIAAFLGREQGNPSINNLWIIDGAKDYVVDRYGHRELLLQSLDTIYHDTIPESEMKDAVECKLFGIGSEAFVVGSHEFYLGYAISRNKLLCIDLGHFHPTELIADKISSVFLYCNEILLHVSRPMRWDSDHVVILNDDIRYLMEELVRSGKVWKTHIGLDFFDATMNRIGAWVLGSRAALKGLLIAFLEPHIQMLEYEEAGNNFARMALLEENKALPFGLVWDEFCERNNTVTDRLLIDEIGRYETEVQLKRS
jgi:L-rhamnose isomerase